MNRMRITTLPHIQWGTFCRTALWCGVLAAQAQAAIALLPTAPTGFAVIPGAPGGLAGTAPAGGTDSDLLRGFSAVASLSGSYDSNITRSPGLPVAPVLEDFILSLGGQLEYLSKASEWTFGGRYRGSYSEYFSQTEFSGYSQGGGVVANYEAGRLSVSLNTEIALDRGSNQNYSSAFVERTNYNSGATARYRLSSKTSLQGNIGHSFTTASGGDFNDTESFVAGASALWRYYPLTELGPGLRYTYLSGSSQTGRTSIGPTMSLNYKLSSKVAMNSRVGMDFAEYEDGGSADPTFSASLGLNYEASKLWGLDFSLYRDTQADPVQAGGFTEVTALRFGYHRKVRRARLNLGLDYNMNRSQLPSNVSGGGGNDRDFFSMDGSVGMPILSNTSFANIYLRYSDQSGSATDTWDSMQVGFSISRGF